MVPAAEPSSEPTLFQRVFYRASWLIVLVFFTVFYRLRRVGSHHVPVTGPCLLIANHQSHLDPPLIGVCITGRPLHFVARVGLFQSRLFAWLITTLNALPIRNDSGDLGAIRQVLTRLEHGHAILMFPEGARTPDGNLQPFKKGIGLLVRRARCPVIPVAIEGCYSAWPRHRKVPRLLGQRVAVLFGEPVSAERLAGLDVDGVTRVLEQALTELHARLKQLPEFRKRQDSPADR